MRNCARSASGVPVLPDQLDLRPTLLNVLNGTLDLETGKLREPSRADWITKRCPTPFDSRARCELWLSVLQRIFNRNDALIGYLKRLFGYSLTGLIGEEILPIAHGPGRNGKSKVLGAFMGMLGADYAMQADPKVLMVKSHGDSHSTERMDFFGKRFVAAIETESGGRLNETFVKQMTGGDPIRGRRMREDTWEYLPTHKTILATNFKPRVSGDDGALWARIRLIPFTVVIPPEERDKRLSQKLAAEYPGILRWCVEGCLEWQRYGLGEPSEVAQATDGYQSEMDSVGRFVDERCRIDAFAKVRVKDLAAAYDQWCRDSSERPVGSRRFGEWFTRHDFERKSSNGTWYLGLGLVTESE